MRTLLLSAALIAAGTMLSASRAALPASAEPTSPGSTSTGSLTASPPIAVPRKPGFFDYMAVDVKYRRLLAAHAGNDQLSIVDMDAGAVLQQVDLGDGAGGAGVAVDARDGKYFVGTAANKVVDVNRKNMVKQADIGLPGPVDALAFDPDNDTLYADEDGGTHVWAINGKTDKLVATIPVPGAPEYVDYDSVTKRIYQNIKPAPSMVLAIDPATNTVTAQWPVAPATRVHGLAIDEASGRVFTIGINGKLDLIDVKTGAVAATVDVEGRVDQIAFDPGNKRVYCPSGTGVMSIVQETDTGASVLGTIAVPRGTHSVAVDPKTHAVWISYGASDNDYVQKLTP